jgi:hypothetical protein
MDERQPGPGEPHSEYLHPLIYKALVVFVVWMVVAAWGFSGGGDSRLVLTAVSLFLFVAVGLPLILWRISRRGRNAGLGAGTPVSFSTWLRCRLGTWQGEMSGTDAALQVILPLAAAAVGMTALVLVLHFDIGA